MFASFDSDKNALVDCHGHRHTIFFEDSGRRSLGRQATSSEDFRLRFCVIDRIMHFTFWNHRKNPRAQTKKSSKYNSQLIHKVSSFVVWSDSYVYWPILFGVLKVRFSPTSTLQMRTNSNRPRFYWTLILRFRPTCSEHRVLFGTHSVSLITTSVARAPFQQVLEPSDKYAFANLSHADSAPLASLSLI